MSIGVLPVVTPIWAAVLVLFQVFLSAHVIRIRSHMRTAQGDDGARLQRAIRAHGNFIEYVPMALLVLLLAELQGAPAWLVHLLGAALLSGRMVHAWGISRVDQDIRLRSAGMALTFSALVGGALTLLWHSLA